MSLYSNVLSITLTILLGAASPSFAAPLLTRKRKGGKSGGGRVTYGHGGSSGSGNGKPLSKKATIIIVSVIFGIVALVLLGLLLWFLWIKYDVGDKLRERRQNREFQRKQKDLEKIRNEHPFVAEQLAAPSPTTPHEFNDQATLVAPPSPYSKSSSVTASPSEGHLSLPPVYSPTAASSSEQLTMPVPVHVNSHADPGAPVPYTRELTPDPEGERAGGWREKIPFLK
ncbi:hypothetical protein FRC04_009288 [Tulasnella sp. 424]|nr:hypothetical protein FRC04_009288 [Tulasnella sp. 424]